MRQQYHFRRSGADLLIWDVNRLVELARHLPVERVPLTQIQELHEAYWFEDRSPTSLEIIEHMRLVHAADLSYPIILCPQGRLMDGMHRVAKAQLAGQADIAAVKLREMPAPDYLNCSADDLPYEDTPS